MITTATRTLTRVLSGPDAFSAELRRLDRPPALTPDRTRVAEAAYRIVGWHAENCQTCKPGSRHAIAYPRRTR